MRLPRASVLLPALLGALAGCGGEPSGPVPGRTPAGAPAAAAPATSEALAQRFRAMVEAAKAQDVAAITRLVTEMVPSKDELRGLLKPGPEAEAWLAAYDGPTLETFKPGDASKAGLGSPTRTEIFVHVSTTEELVAYARGTVAFQEFPGGMKDFARSVAAPGLAWWCVEAREPGKPDGTRYTAFARAGERFVLVVKPWRALRKPAEAGDAAPPR